MNFFFILVGPGLNPVPPSLRHSTYLHVAAEADNKINETNLPSLLAIFPTQMLTNNFC